MSDCNHDDMPEMPGETDLIERNGIEDMALTGPITVEEALQIGQRFIDGHFKNRGKPRPHIEIPANPQRDDDIRLMSFIRQQRIKNNLFDDALRELTHLKAKLAAAEKRAEEAEAKNQRLRTALEKTLASLDNHITRASFAASVLPGEKSVLEQSRQTLKDTAS